VHISFVQSITLDTKWKRKWLKALTSGISNDHQNIKFEYHVPSKWYKPVEDEPRSYRESYIKAKYQKKLFHKGESDNETRRPAHYGKHIKEREKGQDGMISAAILNGDVEAKNVGMTEFQGVVFVTLTNARNLAASDIGGRSDPYVKIRIGRQTVKSKTVPQCLNPEWNEKLILSWTGDSKHELELEVWDEDLMTDDDLLGKARVNLSGISSTKSVGLKIPLADEYATSVHWKDLVVLEEKDGTPNNKKGATAAKKKRSKYCDKLMACFGRSPVSGYVAIQIRFEKIE